MTLKWLAKIFGCFLLIAFLLLPAMGVETAEQKVTKLIKSYVVTKYPAWQTFPIKVNYRFADKTFKQLDAKDYDLSFKIIETYNDIRPVGNVIFPIEVSGKTGTQKIFIRAKVEVLNNVVMAKKMIKRGQAFSSANLEIQQRDVAMLPQKYFLSLKELKGKEAKSTIPKNSTIFAWMVKKVPLVRRGENVTICVTAPNLLVRSRGILLEDGYLNKKIKLKKKGGKDILEGVLKSSSEVEVKLK